MEYNEDKVDETALALMYLTTFKDGIAYCSWKGLDWDILNRLHEKGLISDPKSKAKSIVLSDKAVKMSEQLFKKHFGKEKPDNVVNLKSNKIYQFKITLSDITPVIWRLIQVPERYSFWYLHVAIQDAMGWEDYHLHEFNIKHPKKEKISHIGIPDDESLDDFNKFIAGWNEKIKDWVTMKNNRTVYTYDFGDGWMHDIILEKIISAEKGIKYPICIDGKRKCPPEDVGGPPGYENFLEIINNPDHEEYQERIDWLGKKFDPEDFDPAKIKFDDPEKRWQTAFQDK